MIRDVQLWRLFRTSALLVVVDPSVLRLVVRVWLKLFLAAWELTDLERAVLRGRIA